MKRQFVEIATALIFFVSFSIKGKNNPSGAFKKYFILYILSMGNLFTVVDENDNIIGYKPKKDIDPIKEYYRVSGLRLTNSQGDILIAQRALTKSHNPGQRGPAVAGTIEKGESYEDNIIKEMKEEIGLTGVSVTPGPKTKKEETEEYHYFGQRFFATVDKDISQFTIQEDEVEAIKWISPEELKKDIEAHPEKYLKNMKKYVTELEIRKV